MANLSSSSLSLTWKELQMLWKSIKKQKTDFDYLKIELIPSHIGITVEASLWKQAEDGQEVQIARYNLTDYDTW